MKSPVCQKADRALSVSGGCDESRHPSGAVPQEFRDFRILGKIFFGELREIVFS